MCACLGVVETFSSHKVVHVGVVAFGHFWWSMYLICGFHVHVATCRYIIAVASYPGHPMLHIAHATWDGLDTRLGS